MYNRILSKVNEYNMDAFLIQNQVNINWICNKENYYLPSIILVTTDTLFIFTKSRNIDEFKQIYKEHNILEGDLKDVYQKCKELGLSSLGIEANYVSVHEYNSLENQFKDVELLPTIDFIEDIRMIKTEKEIELIQAATALSDQAYLEFLNHLKIGMTEIEAKNVFRQIIFQKGAHDLSFDILLSSGKRTFLPHSASTDKIIEFGDLVLMDFGIVLEGYCSDTTRTVVMGEATDMQRDLYDLVLKAQINALNSIKSGVTLKEADYFARGIIENEISEGCFDYGLGHGIGMLVHEKPRMHPNNIDIMRKNTVVSVEPGIYIKGWGGIRIEDLLVVSDEAPGQNLTRCPKDFMIIK